MIDLVAVTEGPGVSTHTVQRACPRVPRRVIADYLRRFRQACRAALCSLRWRTVGRVWAADWAAPPRPLDGRDHAVVHVRDLASGFRIGVVPIPRATGAAVTGVLQAACADADPPLVLKLDNGGACRSRRVREWAATAGVTVLSSPPRTPTYNGSIEASIGAVATRAHEAAAWHGHPEYWTSDDLTLARDQANRAVGPGGTSAALRWQARSRITTSERRRFASALSRARDRLVTTSGTAYSGRVRDRLAIVRTLQELRYVRIIRSGEFGHSFSAKTRTT
jgi:hypothetical protein